MGFPCSSAGKESAHNVGNLGSIPGLGRSPGDLKATHSGILDSRILAKSQTQLSNFHFYFSQDMEAGQPQGIILAIPLFFPLLHILFLLVMLCAKQGLFPPPVKKENSNGCMLKANWQLQIV